VVHFRRVERRRRTSTFAPRTRACVRLDSAWINCFAALRAGQDRSKVVPTIQVPVKKRRPILAGKVLIAPMHKPNQDRVKAKASLGEAVLIARRRILISHFRKYIVFYQVREPFSQHASRNAKSRLKVVKAADTQERFTQHKQRPPIADHGERPRQRAILLTEVLPSHRVGTLPLTPSYFKT
jgi:hypothetical protein